MPQSLSRIVVHLVFSTKDRLPTIASSVRTELHAYLGSTVRELGCEGVHVGGTVDHVHVALRLPRTVAIAKVVEEAKKSSSKWMKAQAPQFQRFEWQRGYASISVGPTDEPALLAYIENQEEHHRNRTFQEEVLAFFKKYGMRYDERYVWD